MKQLLTLLIAIFTVFAVSAQSEKSIIIDQNSFCAVQSDALTGVNIDPIGMDSSRRPCARIKVKINRMTREEIDRIEVKIVTNNELRKCKTADYENGLILEMTAKSATRFYLNHPRYGESNEVNLSLEPDKEYRIDAYLNQQLSITIISDVVGADVYIDDIFVGQTNANKMLAVHNVTPEKHALRVEYSGRRAIKDISVSSDNFAFLQDVLSARYIKSETAITTERLSKSITRGLYKVGDYYNDGTKEGVVFEVSADGRQGKIISMKQSSSGLQWASDREEQKRFIGLNSETNGEYNMRKVKTIANWQSKYPAFKWCAELGEDWYLPAKKELVTIYDNKDKLNFQLTDKLIDEEYWSSTDCNYQFFGVFCAWSVYMNNGISYNAGKDANIYIRAVSKFNSDTIHNNMSLEDEKIELDKRLSRIRAEKESYENLVSEEAKNMAPTFGLR